MITVFNRRELLVTFDMDHCAEVREKLSETGIPYVVRTRNLYGGGNRTAVGIDVPSAYEYHIYVKRGDYDKAMHAIR